MPGALDATETNCSGGVARWRTTALLAAGAERALGKVPRNELNTRVLGKVRTELEPNTGLVAGFASSFCHTRKLVSGLLATSAKAGLFLFLASCCVSGRI